ncbi:hypothetical protein TNCV_4174111 [Trichonephila clavipes]|nr:hypothetical protein TNCV_4174111 [Trichonephila clavipes]
MSSACLALSSIKIKSGPTTHRKGEHRAPRPHPKIHSTHVSLQRHGGVMWCPSNVMPVQNVKSPLSYWLISWTLEGR